MDNLLLKLRGLPEDEIEGLRALLSDHHIDHYRTPQNSFGMGLPALWVRDRGQLEHARRLLREYRTERARRLRADAASRRDAGDPSTVLGRLRARRAESLLYLLVLVWLAYLVGHSLR